MNTGILGSFATPDALLRAVRDLRRRGYHRLDAFTPYPVKGLEQALGLSRSPLPKIVFPVAMAGAGLAYLVQLWCNGYDYPINVGGRPLDSVPAFIPITFESAVLVSSLAGVFVFLLLTSLPWLHAPVDDVEGFERASIDRFWVAVDDRDPRFSAVDLERELRDLGALSVGHARRRPR
jgi:Protein of unknown function (DUF3341)